MNPIISVIVPTHNRSKLLIKQLEALATQSLSPELYEVLIVDDGSTDSTPDLFKTQSFPSNFRYLRKEQAGPAQARNFGALNARGVILSFTDDDCIADPNWLYAVADSFNDPLIRVAHGCTFTNKETKTPLTHQIESNSWNPVIPTCNAAYRKSFFFEIGGFDTEFPYAHNEDTDLAWKALERSRVIFNPEMKVYHPPIEVPLSKQVKRLSMLKSEFLLFKRHKKSYQRWRARSPWHTIYGLVFFYHQIRLLKFHLGFYRKPSLMIKGIAISLWSWVYLIILFPSFLKENQKIRSLS
jgi:glycosyltransferase involved in cell wall biosynthesis